MSNTNTQPLSDQIHGFLLDMDGTFYLGGRLLPGAAAFLAYAREVGLPLLFLTNNSSRDRRAYAAKLAEMGVTVSPDEIFTSGEATARYLSARWPQGTPVAVFGTPYLEQTFRDFGFTLTFDDPALVVLGYDKTITYPKLVRLCDLVRAGLPYIATHPDLNCPVEGGYEPDIGAIMALVEASTGRRADVVVGKPHAPMVEMAAQKLGLPVEALCMVGDRLYTDIAMGQTAPLHTALVLSGETRPDDLARSAFQPDYVFDDLMGLLEAAKSSEEQRRAAKGNQTTA